jgi:hypothetical protein
MNWDSVATRYGAGQSEVRIPTEAGKFSLLQNTQTGPGTHPDS